MKFAVAVHIWPKIAKKSGSGKKTQIRLNPNYEKNKCSLYLQRTNNHVSTMKMFSGEIYGKCHEDAILLISCGDLEKNSKRYRKREGSKR